MLTTTPTIGQLAPFSLNARDCGADVVRHNEVAPIVTMNVAATYPKS